MRLCNAAEKSKIDRFCLVIKRVPLKRDSFLFWGKWRTGVERIFNLPAVNSIATEARKHRRYGTQRGRGRRENCRLLLKSCVSFYCA